MTTLNIQIEVSLTGDLTRYRPATYNDPAEGGEVEGLEVAGIASEVRSRAMTYAELRDVAAGKPHPQGLWKTVDLLDGVDVTSPAVQRLFDNILRAHRRDAEQAIVDDVLARAA